MLDVGCRINSGLSHVPGFRVMTSDYGLDTIVYDIMLY